MWHEDRRTNGDKRGRRRCPPRLLAVCRAAIVGVAVLMLSTGASRAGQPTRAGRVTRDQGIDSVRIPVLVYHSVAPHHPGQTRLQRQFDVDPATFEAQMQLLRQCGIDVISFGHLVDVLRGRLTAPAHAVVITFDDGWENEYRHAFPVLRRLGLTATFFVFTAPIGRESRFVTWDQLREMRDAGMNIESHSRTHPLLKRGVVSLTSEIAGSRRDIAQHLGESPLYFAYPFGGEDDRVIAAVKAAGFTAARGFGGGVWNNGRSVWDIRSVEVTDDMNAFRRTLQSAGVRGCGSR